MATLREKDLIVWRILCFIWFLCQTGTPLPPSVYLGGLFDTAGDDAVSIAFQNAVEHVNSDSSVAKKSLLRNISHHIPQHDSFTASKKVCEMIKSGMAGIFGPRSSNTAAHVQSMCDTLGIPHVEIRWDHRETRDELSVNLHPHPESLGKISVISFHSVYNLFLRLSYRRNKAYRDVLETLRWHKYTVLYADNEGLFRLQEILKLKPPPDKELKLTIRQLVPDGDNRPLLKGLKKAGETHIILDCPVEKIYSVMEQALQVGMLTEYHNYFITSLDFHAVDMRLFKDSNTNITGLSIVDIDNNKYTDVMGREWAVGIKRFGPPGNSITFNEDLFTPYSGVEAHMDAYLDAAHILPRTLMTAPALMYDAVTLFGMALFKLDADTPDGLNLSGMQCNQNNVWDEGRNLVWFMKMLTLEGMTGSVRLDAQGFRKEFSLDILEVGKKGLEKVGRWDKLKGANYTRLWSDREADIREELKDKNLIVTVPINPPYVMWKANKDELQGNDRFEGFCIDLIREIADILGFNFTFRLSKDGKYGSRDKITGEWNGMIRELLDRESDLATADLTISYEREQAVDFTMPFMNLGIGILYKKPAKKAPNLFSFLSPLSLDVWIYMATAYLGVSILLFILARFTPYEWDNPHRCIKEPDHLENQFSLKNSMWFTIGSLMQQGSDIAPKAVSTRMVAGMWWFFTLIMISSYTANLAAFLTVERMESAIQSAEDLAKQTKIKYGSMGSGSTKAFFRDSKIETYQRMWSFMESARPSVFPKNNQEGVDRVKAGGYAYLMESTSIEYVVEKHCELMQVGGLLDNKGYGIALPPGSPYTSAISSAILRLQEKGRFLELKTRWWKEKNEGAGNCDAEGSKASSTSASELGLANVGGVFVVLMGGMGVAILIALCEFIWKSRKLALEEHASLCQEMGKEMQFALRCRGSTKPVPKHIQKSSSSATLDRQQSQRRQEQLQRQQSQQDQQRLLIQRQRTLDFETDADDVMIDEETRLDSDVSSPMPMLQGLSNNNRRSMLRRQGSGSTGQPTAVQYNNEGRPILPSRGGSVMSDVPTPPPPPSIIGSSYYPRHQPGGMVSRPTPYGVRKEFIS